MQACVLLQAKTYARSRMLPKELLSNCRRSSMSSSRMAPRGGLHPRRAVVCLDWLPQRRNADLCGWPQIADGVTTHLTQPPATANELEIVTY